MADEFFSNIKSHFDDYDITPDQISTLTATIGNTITSEDAARCLTLYPEASFTPVELTQRLGGLWTLLNDTAVRLPSSQETIISVLQAIRKLPKAKVPAGEGEDYMDFDDGFYWKELTGWANNWADAFGSYASRFLIEPAKSDEDRTDRKKTWTNACAYSARLTATGDEALSSYGSGLDRATRAISEALESDTGDKEPESLEAAAEVFINAASELYRRCKEGRTDGMLAGKAKLWQGHKGFSLTRWQFWLKRWDVLAQQKDISDHGREFAQKALKAMQEAEGAED
ncbi:hypothetical protein FB567DRAFT_190873 [Paraphoma chrysanthemicola]|uniref:Uncharacterized protein n=1 Tax=Paraphoma chrysanthemicola TaxID=798071 RepID=A0A8K0QVN1_9PLEO|nr:hypothetical protein FB567DRAFT_190873 [Paraphoma chrysanthemicola]